jgi:hypothetical protein
MNFYILTEPLNVFSELQNTRWLVNPINTQYSMFGMLGKMQCLELSRLFFDQQKKKYQKCIKSKT